MEDDLKRLCAAYHNGRANRAEFRKGLLALFDLASDADLHEFAEIVLAGLSEERH